MQLFRQQALDHQNRLHGEIFLAPPLRWQAVGWLLLALVLVAGLFLTFTSYSRTVSAAGTMQAIAADPPRGAQPASAAIAPVAHLRVPIAHAAQVAPGQSLMVLPKGYTARAFGTIRGRVTAVGAPVTGRDTPYVPVTAQLAPLTPQQAAHSLPRGEMPVEASIVVGRMSLLRWLFEPILPATGR